MVERRNFRTKVDRYLRRKNTILAKGLHVICPLEGQEYRESYKKRVAEVIMVLPIAVATLPILGILAFAAKLEDGGRAFYVQKRIGKDGTPVPLVKIRCMREGADEEQWSISHERNQILGEANDPRNTRVGRFMRKYELEELPQLWQVILGTIALVDIRAVAKYATDLMQKKMSTKAYNNWMNIYKQGRPGLFSLNSAVNNRRKDDMRRSPLDHLFAHRDSLGLDLFVLYRTALRMEGKLDQKISSFIETTTSFLFDSQE